MDAQNKSLKKDIIVWSLILKEDWGCIGHFGYLSKQPDLNSMESCYQKAKCLKNLRAVIVKLCYSPRRHLKDIIPPFLRNAGLVHVLHHGVSRGMREERCYAVKLAQGLSLTRVSMWKVGVWILGLRQLWAMLKVSAVVRVGESSRPSVTVLFLLGARAMPRE